MTADRPPAALKIEGVAYSYGDRPILRGVDLDLPPGRIVALLGASGSGKTTLLNIVAGLLAPQRGRVTIDGRLVAEDGRLALPPERRGLGMVFQDYALWPHMSVAKNIAFPLEMARIGREERAERVARALDLVGLRGFEQRMPFQLSGGQQQRAALARAIVGEPSLILFDEPLSNLDRELREQLAHELRDLMRTLSVAALYVTHDQSEAFTLADTIVVMRDGMVAQAASPEELIHDPADGDIASFLNLGALASAELTQQGWTLRGGGRAIAPASAWSGAATARILIPHRSVTLTAPDAGDLLGAVVRSTWGADGLTNVVRLDGEGPEITVTSAFGVRPKPGDRVGLSIDGSALRWFCETPDGGDAHAP